MGTSRMQAAGQQLTALPWAPWRPAGTHAVHTPCPSPRSCSWRLWCLHSSGERCACFAPGPSQATALATAWLTPLHACCAPSDASILLVPLPWCRTRTPWRTATTSSESSSVGGSCFRGGCVESSRVQFGATALLPPSPLSCGVRVRSQLPRFMCQPLCRALWLHCFAHHPNECSPLLQTACSICCSGQCRRCTCWWRAWREWCGWLPCCLQAWGFGMHAAGWAPTGAQLSC